MHVVKPRHSQRLGNWIWSPLDREWFPSALVLRWAREDNNSRAVGRNLVGSVAKLLTNSENWRKNEGSAPPWFEAFSGALRNIKVCLENIQEWGWNWLHYRVCGTDQQHGNRQTSYSINNKISHHLIQEDVRKSSIWGTAEAWNQASSWVKPYIVFE